MKAEDQTPVLEPARGHDVFVSYTRADRGHVVDLTRSLLDHGKRAWVDLEEIPPSAEWMAEIRAAIDAADGYLVVISPDLARSTVCAEELDHARAAGKRIVPVLVRSTDPSSVPPLLAALNWIDATEDLDGAAERIVQALETDLEHVKAHTRLLVRASEWETRNEPRAMLLRGSDLKDAEAWLVSSQGKEPAPTPVQARFVQVSRRGATGRQRAAVALALVVALVAASLGVFAWQQRGEAIDQRAVAERRAAESRSRELASASVGQLAIDPELSLLLASEAMKAQRTPEAVDALRQAIAGSGVRATFTGHGGPISVVEYSPDGSRLLTASYDGTARIWDVADEADPIALSGHTDLLVGASYSTDGTKVATVSFDGTARVWDALTGSPLATLQGNGGAVYDAAFTPEGAAVITGDGSGTAAVWDLETGERIHVLEGHVRPIYDVDVSADGALALTASDDGSARIWDLESGELVRTLEGHTDGLYVARFSPDASTVVTGSEDSSARLWDAGSGKELRSLLARGPVVDAAFAPLGDRVAIASEDHAARVWDTTSGRALVLRGHQDELNSVAFGPDGSMVVTTSNDGTARVWDVESGTTVAVLRGHEGQVLDASFSPDGTFVASGGEDGTARVWEPSSGRQVLDTRVWTMSQSPDGTQVAVSTMNGHVVVIDARSGDELMDVDAAQTQIGAVITADEELVVSASIDGIGHVWEIASGDLVADLVGHEPGWTVPVPVTVPDRALTFSDDGTARLWDTRTGEGIATFEHGGPSGVGIGDAALSADGGQVVTGGAAQDVIRLWNADNGDQVWEVDDLLSLFQGISVNLDPNGSSLVVVTGQTEILDSKDGHRIAVLDAPELINNARFSPDGSSLVTYSNDGPLRIWDAKTGDLTATMPGEEASSVDARFSHDGRWVVAVERDGPIRIWDPSSGSAVASIDAAHGASRAYFVAGDRSVVSNDGQGVRIDRCDVCGSVEELIHLADERVTRGFTDSERRTYLGDGSGTTADEEARPAGLVDTDGREVNDGQLPAGSYSAVGFSPGLTFTVPEGWIATSDNGWASVGEVQVATSVVLQDQDVAAPWLQFLNLEPGRVMDGWKEWDERLNVIPFPMDLATWVEDHPHLELLRAGSVEIGGFAGAAVDFRVSSLQEENLPPMCGDCLPTMPITLSNQTGPLGKDLFGGSQLGSVERWVEVGTPEGPILVMIFSTSERGLEMVWEAVQPIIETVEIGN